LDGLQQENQLKNQGRSQNTLRKPNTKPQSVGRVEIILFSFCLFQCLWQPATINVSLHYHVMENCINRALYGIFGSCDNLEFLRWCIGLDYVEVLSQQKNSRFIDGLIGDARFFFKFAFNSCFKFVLNVCMWYFVSVCLSCLLLYIINYI